MEDNYGINGLLDMASTDYKLSSLAGGASAFAQMAGGMMDYSALKTNAAALKVQANNIELQAQQRANILREQFIGAIGSYQFSAANRGVSVGSGSVRQNIESSAIGLGKDIQKAQRVAQMQASALRTQAKLAKIQGKTAMVTGILGGISSLAGAVGSYSKGVSLDNLAKSTSTEQTKIVPVPPKKPF
jgi:hypothetical protein